MQNSPDYCRFSILKSINVFNFGTKFKETPVSKNKNQTENLSWTQNEFRSN